MTHAVARLLIASLILTTIPSQSFAYLKFGVRIGTNVTDVKWNRAVPYFVTERAVPGVSVSDLRDAIGRAFATWQRVPTAAVRSEFQGFTIAPPSGQDGRTAIGFLDRPDLDRVLGATSFLLDAATGEIIEADVFFNTRFDWSTAAAGEPGRVDLESVALHEIGHLLGLGHSALGETEMAGGGRRVIGSAAIMFPIALSAGTIADRELQPDDRAGITDIYPAGSAEQTTGSISGHITKNGAGVFGGHAAAFNLETGDLIGGFALNAAGEYVIGGLVPGAYLLRVEPLDDADTESFFSGPVDVDFRVAYASRVVIVPRRGGADGIDVDVRPK